MWISASTFESCGNSSAAGASKSLVAWSSSWGLTVGSARSVTVCLGSEWIPSLSGREAAGTSRKPAGSCLLSCHLLAQICRRHPWIAREAFAGAFDHHVARFKYVTVIRDLQRRPCILLDQQNRHAGGLQRTDNAENLLYDQRRQAQAGFVEHQQARLGHQ